MLYRTVCQLFKPTPAHSHYVFGPRDLSKIFQGMLLVMKNAQTGEQSFRQMLSNQSIVAGLWVSECSRVLGDRLINAEDIGQFNKQLSYCWSNTEVSQQPLERLVPEGSYNSLEKRFDISFGSALGSSECYYQYLNVN